MIQIFDIRVSANEYAKWVVYDRGDAAFYFAEWNENQTMTEREKEAVTEAIEKQHLRVRKMMGIDKIMHKCLG